MKMKGSFTAPFDGSHGWYWENESDTPVRCATYGERPV